MYGSYGSYGSIASSQLSAPMDIASSSRQRAGSPDFSCAFPSWPRRSSLSSADGAGDEDRRATSYLSDEDLFPLDYADAAVDDDSSDAHSISSAGSAPRAAALDDAALRREQRDAYQREAARLLVAERERERRRLQAQMARRAARRSQQAPPPAAPRKSPKTAASKLVNMTPIAEATGE